MLAARAVALAIVALAAASPAHAQAAPDGAVLVDFALLGAGLTGLLLGRRNSRSRGPDA